MYIKQDMGRQSLKNGKSKCTKVVKRPLEHVFQNISDSKLCHINFSVQKHRIRFVDAKVLGYLD